jgi:ParB-like chromosome segregation protein Spo0J
MSIDAYFGEGVEGMSESEFGQPSGSQEIANKSIDEQPTVMVAVNALMPADSPRLLGIDEVHAQLLADLDSELPPILVQHGSMRVIDGMHRLRAAQLNGQSHIRAHFFDGPDEAAFLRAVSANVTHGLPLSLADREAAALRIISSFPHWSDRAVAKASGLSGKTVGALRRQMGDDLPQPQTRLGQDGRVRPLNGAIGRRIASELILTRPSASLREIAQAAGISPATVRDVRDRMGRGVDPLSDRQRRAETERLNDRSTPSRFRDSPRPSVDYLSVLDNLRRDPSLRYTESGRAILRWLDRRLIGSGEYENLVDGIPPHCLPVIARLARHCALEWKDLTDQLDQRMRNIA